MEIDLKWFLKDLELLTEKYKIVIGGCGCCGSPFLYKLDDDRVIKYNLEYYNGSYNVSNTEFVEE